MKNIIENKIKIAEKRILGLNKSQDIKKLSIEISYQIAKFYENKSNNRLETANLIFQISKNNKIKRTINTINSYSDYSEAVSCSYYAMYYIVHSFLALKYKTKLREDLRGVHAITHHLILYYLVKTKRLAKHLYEEFVNTLETTKKINKIADDFQEKAYSYAEKYNKSRDAREIFTYKVSKNAEEFHAKQAINTAQEFINTIKQVMLR